MNLTRKFSDSNGMTVLKCNLRMNFVACWKLNSAQQVYSIEGGLVTTLVHACACLLVRYTHVVGYRTIPRFASEADVILLASRICSACTYSETSGRRIRDAPTGMQRFDIPTSNSTWSTLDCKHDSGKLIKVQDIAGGNFCRSIVCMYVRLPGAPTFCGTRLQ